MQPSIKIRIYKWLDRMLSELVRIVPHPKRAIERGPARVLIIKLSAMGDSLCLFPAVRQLAAAFPAAKIDWLTSNRSNPALFDELPFIRTIFVTPPSFARVLAYLAGWLIKARRYDLAIDYDQYYCISELVAGRSAYSAGFKTSLKGTTFSLSIEYEPLLNEKMMFRKLTERVIAVYGASSPEYRAELPELIERFEPGEKLRLLRKQLKEHGKPVVGIYPGSGANAAFRRWGIGNYVSLIERYKDRFVFVILGGPDEHDLQADLKNIEGVCNLIDTMSLKEVAWLMKYSIDLVVGNDGGLLHVAESQAVATVGIFGPALYRKWGSLQVRSIGVEKDLPCRPCLKNYLGTVPSTCCLGTTACLTAISTEDVAQAMHRIVHQIHVVPSVHA